MLPMIGIPLAGGGNIRTGVEAFQEIFTVFLILGTLVGIVVIGYMLYNAIKYRAGKDRDYEKEPEGFELGELPKGSGGGRKLLLSFSLSAIIVVGLVFWTYGTLLYLNDGPSVPPEERMDVRVEGYQFGWTFVYENGKESSTLRVPEGEVIWLEVTSRDVFHTFAISELRVKTDAIPGQTTTTWFVTNETGTYQAQCFELCGTGHSFMDAQVVVMEQEEFEDWYTNSSTQNNATVSTP